MRLERFEERGIHDSFIAGHLGGQLVVLVHEQKISRHLVIRQVGYFQWAVTPSVGNVEQYWRYLAQ